MEVCGKALATELFFCNVRSPDGLFSYIVKVESPTYEDWSLYPMSLKPIKLRHMLLLLKASLGFVRGLT